MESQSPVPTAILLTDAALDPQSKIPDYEYCVVRVEAESSAAKPT